MDDAFRQQLDVKEQNHARALRTLQQQAHDDVAAANKRVSAGPRHTTTVAESPHPGSFVFQTRIPFIAIFIHQTL